MFKKLRAYVHKDVKFEDETSQFFVMMRIYYLITAVYIAIYLIISFATGAWRKMPIVIIWLPLHLASFFSTYRLRRRAVFHTFSCGILIWIVSAVYYMGWDYGAQYFMYPLMVISFFATYRNHIGKIIYVAILCIIHEILFSYTRSHEPIVVLSESVGYLVQILHTLTLFVCMFVICFIFSNTNQSALAKLAVYNERLKREAETDALTGLMNRHSMYKMLDNYMNDDKLQTFTVAMGDIDHFKRINDTRGHNCGDEVLRKLSAYFKEAVSNRGIVCRWGGEEFLFLFPSMGADKVYEIVSEMRRHIENIPINFEGETFSLTVTFGIEEYTSQLPMKELIRRADEKLYRGKNSGRNKVVK